MSDAEIFARSWQTLPKHAPFCSAMPCYDHTPLEIVINTQWISQLRLKFHPDGLRDDAQHIPELWWLMYSYCLTGHLAVYFTWLKRWERKGRGVVPKLLLPAKERSMETQYSLCGRQVILIYCRWCKTVYYYVGDTLQSHSQGECALLNFSSWSHQTRDILSTAGNHVTSQHAAESWPTFMHNSSSKGFSLEIELLNFRIKTWIC